MAPKKSKGKKAKAAKTSSKSSTTKKNSGKSNNFWAYFTPTAVVVFLLPVLLAYIIFAQQIQPERLASFNEKNEQVLEQYKTQLDAHLDALALEVESLAKLNSVRAKVATLEMPDSMPLSASGETNLENIIVFPRGNHRPNPNFSPAITFIMINNAFNATRSGSTTIEIEGELLYVTAQIKANTGDVLGALTAAVTKDEAFAESASILQGHVAVQVLQAIDQSETVVYQYSGWVPNKAITYDKKFHDVLRLKAQWINKVQKGFFDEFLIIFTAIGLGILNVVALIIAASLYNRALSHDLEMVRDAMIDLFRGKNPGKERFQLKHIADTYENIYDNLKNTATITGGSNLQQSSELMSDSLFNDQESDAEPVKTKKPTYSRERYAMETLDQSKELEVQEIEQPETEAATESTETPLSQSIFRAYDIRGIYPTELSESVVESIGRAIGSAAIDAGVREVTVARDGRLSGPALIKALRKGLKKSGVIVIDIGMVPTPVLYYAAKKLTQGTGVMLTGSHNPSNYNGLKIMIAGKTLYGDTIQDLYNRIQDGNLAKGTGQVLEKDVMDDYQGDLIGDIVLSRALKIAVDCGNGVTGVMMPQLFEQLGVEASGLYTEVDGSFPNHSPDPSQPKNMVKLIEVVKEQGADIGLAFDGDGDRVGVITPSGRMVYADRLMMLFSEHVLAANPGADIIYDVKCSSDLTQVIRNAGGRPLMWKTGHSLIKAKLKETNAPLAGEMSGHIFFNDRWNGFDDAIYAAARLLEILSSTTDDLDTLLDKYPEKVSTPELHVHVTDESKFKIVADLAEKGQFGNGSVNQIDGVRVDFEKGWGLLRASNTTPVLVARFEADNEEVIQMIKGMFRENLLAVAPDVKIDF